MKKLLCAGLAVLMLLLAVAPAMAISIRGVNPGDVLYVATSGGKLNMRAQASAHAARVTKLDYGTALIATSEYKAPFLKVTIKGKKTTGWVDINYLSATKPSPVKPTAAPSEDDDLVKDISFRNYKLPTDEVTVVAVKPSRVGGSVNLRWIPSMQAAVLRKMYSGELLTVVTVGPNWYQVQTEDGYVGFVVKKFTTPVYSGKASGYTAK